MERVSETFALVLSVDSNGKRVFNWEKGDSASLDNSSDIFREGERISIHPLEWHAELKDMKTVCLASSLCPEGIVISEKDLYNYARGRALTVEDAISIVESNKNATFSFSIDYDTYNGCPNDIIVKIEKPIEYDEEDYIFTDSTPLNIVSALKIRFKRRTPTI